MTAKIKENEKVVLFDEKGEKGEKGEKKKHRKKKFLLKIEDKEVKRKGIGYFNSSVLIGKECGERIKINDKEFVIMKPSLLDLIEGMGRKAQIITPKDASHIIFNCSIHSGSRVVEAGVGSGALTIALAHFVFPDGKVTSYDLRSDFVRLAKRNVEMSGYESLVEIKMGDVTQSIEEREVDAVIFDFSHPWDAIENGHNTLKKFGHLCCYCPTVNQIELSVKEMKRVGFVEIKTIEVMERSMIIREGSSRPDNRVIGHTGYMCFGRKI